MQPKTLQSVLTEDAAINRHLQIGVALRLPPQCRKTFSIISVTLLILILGSYAKAQTETPKFELGDHFSAHPLDDDPSNNLLCDVCGTFTYAGIGGRFTYNLNGNVALESELNFFLRENERMTSRRVGGRPTQDCLA